jgi:alpha-galactosidase
MKASGILILILFLFFGCSQKPADFHQWAKTPPMGWNSWDCFGPTVTEDEVKANADYMAEHLKKYGWEYIVVDIRWYVGNDKAHGYNEKDAVYSMDEYGRFLPAINRFPSAEGGKGFKELANYIHSKGLKFGIHLMRGIPVEAVRKRSPILGSNASADDVYSDLLQCGWLKDMYTIDTSKDGAQQYYNSIFDLYASWGVDFVKVDDLSRPYHTGEIEMIRKAIDRTGREIVFSTSPGETLIDSAEHVKSHANMWRIVDDFWDNWPMLKHEFAACERWAPHIGTGHFPDADMLPLGKIGIRAERGDPRMTNFTVDEQYTLMTLFSIFRSPLMYGGDLPGMDDFTLSLITNEEVLSVNKNSTGNRQLFRENDLVAWTADDPATGDKFLALFNAQDQVKFLEEKALWKSELINKQHQSEDLNVDLKNARKLFLMVTDGGDSNSWDHADWLMPELSGVKGKINLTELKWIKATSGWDETKINLSVGGEPLKLGGKTYSNGIGTHARSIIEYNIPEGYNKFKAKVAVDDRYIDKSDGATARFLIFSEDNGNPAPQDSVMIPVKFEQIGLNGKCAVRDLWSKTDLGEFTEGISPYVRNHGAKFYRISQR